MASVAAAVAIYRLAMRYIPRHTDESLIRLGIKKKVLTQENGKPYMIFEYKQRNIFGERTDLALTKKDILNIRYDFTQPLAIAVVFSRPEYQLWKNMYESAQTS